MNLYEISATLENGAVHKTKVYEINQERALNRASKFALQFDPTGCAKKTVQMIQKNAGVPKDTERAFLNEIKEILEGLGPDSYCAWAFEGCVEDAEENISNDFAVSMRGRWENEREAHEKTRKSLTEKLNEQGQRIAELEAEVQKARQMEAQARKEAAEDKIALEKAKEKIIPDNVAAELTIMLRKQADEAAKGNGFHCITYMEWAFLALLAKKNGTMPKGNNNYGKDSSETAIVAIPTFIDTGAGNKTGRVATGTGPVTWSDTGAMDGVWDLNGNVWEWIRGVRLVCGELQAIPYNNAADASVNTGASSNEWRALNASATSYNDLFVVPDGKGTTAGTVKLDWVSGHWQWGTSIADASDTSRYASFAKTTASGLSATAKLYLQAMAFLPEDGASDADYGNDVFWANNAAAERCAYRGGNWYNGANGGVFALNLNDPRSNRWTHLGGRLACDEETEN